MNYELIEFYLYGFFRWENKLLHYVTAFRSPLINISCSSDGMFSYEVSEIFQNYGLSVNPTGCVLRIWLILFFSAIQQCFVATESLKNEQITGTKKRIDLYTIFFTFGINCILFRLRNNSTTKWWHTKN